MEGGMEEESFKLFKFFADGDFRANQRDTGSIFRNKSRYSIKDIQYILWVVTAADSHFKLRH